ncbi:eCIS core domain-containing protein [Streptomyces yaizuensis]|uniref:DUF4157 domain-containing protein n=1 Tax=Streptomyces yaizuensis TaxID=2989713 RepID=A0ABQ5NS94_9ACTN|nr:DUF4157 domain-containing protein [Streptomyces sp. YSPA8]GLF93127.1 DUF4157 domain-containing protein [Streptomyces sp. YSPA8]
MTTHSPAQDGRAPDRARGKKRPSRAALPEPRRIVSGAGQPLDPGVRRDLEERLGHDLGRVRLHTDRDAGALTALLGADAVAVGQDILFREGAYVPGTAAGHRLLAHELLHTLQNPDGLGTLRAGRDPGAVSLAHQPVEREAESTARALTEQDAPGASTSVEPGHATPGWLRYATVDADRARLEAVDPATLVDRLANDVLRSLRGDPTDSSGRVRLHLGRMSPDLQDLVLDRLEIRLPAPEHDRLVRLAEETDPDSLPFEASTTPHALPDALEEIEREHESDEAAWRARLENAERVEDERVAAARRRPAVDPRTAEGSGGAAGEPGRSGSGGASAQGSTGATRESTASAAGAAEAKPLEREEPAQAAEEKGSAQDGKTATGQEQEGERKEAADTAEPQQEAVRQAGTAVRRTGSVRPGPVDRSAAEQDDTRAGPPATDPAPPVSGPEDEPLGLEESGVAEALAELEGLLGEEEAVEPAPEAASSLPPSTLDASTPAASAPGTDQEAGRSRATPPSPPRMQAEEAEELASSLEEADSETERTDPEPDGGLATDRPLDQEVGPDPGSDAADRSAPPQVATGDRETDEDARSGEAQDRDLASETRRAGSPSGAEPTGNEATGGASAPGKLARADEDARGQATGAAPGGGGAGGGSPAGGTRTQAPAKPIASVTPARASAPRAPSGGDTSVVPPAREVVPAAPRSEGPPRHERARVDDDRPVKAKAPPRARTGGRPTAGGGAGGRPTAAPKKAAAPNVAGVPPEAGLAAAAGLPPHLALTTLKGVDTAVGTTAGKERGALQAAPPAMERPVGSPTTVRGGPRPDAPGTYTSEQVGETQAAQGRTPEITGEKTPSGDLPGGRMKEPGWWDITIAVGGALARKLLSKLLPLDKLTNSISGLPTTDKGLQGAKVGDAPKLPLTEDSDPQRTDQQARLLDDRSAELHTAGRDDAARPMGEDQIYPDVPRETLTAKVSGGKRQAGPGTRPAGAPGAGLPLEAVSAVAEHEQGPQIKQAFGRARQSMATVRRAKETKARQDRRTHEQSVRREVTANTKEQADARDRGRAEIVRSRGGWRKEQDDKLAAADGKKSKQFTKVRKDITDKQEKTDQDVDKRTKEDQKKIDDKRTSSEQEVVQKRDDGKKDSGNWFEKGLNWIKEQFNKLKKAIKDVFERARNLVKGVIEEFKKQVFALIDTARKWVIEQINEFADMLIRLGDELLKDYPALRDKWRRTINGYRDAAVRKVNQAADKLKKVAGTLIDGLGGMLLAGLDLMEGGLLLAVDIAETVTVKSLEIGAAILKGLGEWADIATDILSDPGGWLVKAKDAAVTGARQHLFTEIKAAVREWFNQKLQQLIGIPMDMFQRLIKGGVSKEEMAQMAWDEALPQLPLIIGELIVTKVVAKLIPGAGWVMAIIDALKTAYEALGAILRAFGAFMSFLKAVKGGNAALLFAKAVASGVVALLELIYQWLVSGVGKYLGKVGQALRDRAARLGGKGTDPKDRTPDPKRPEPRKDPKDDPAPRPGQPAKKDDRPAPAPTPGRKPTPKPAPAKEKRDDEERRRDGRYVNTAGRGLTNASRSLGPPAKPDRRPTPKRPEPGKPTGRRPEPAKPKDSRPASRRPDRDDKHPGTKESPRPKPRTRALNRARQAVKAALAKVRRAIRALRGKARALRDRLRNLARRLRDKWRRMRERMRRDHRREDERRRRREKTRDLNLPSTRFRDTPGVLHTLKFSGRGGGAELNVHSSVIDAPQFLRFWKIEINEMQDSKKKEQQSSFHRAAWDDYRQVKIIQRRLPRRVPRSAVPAKWQLDFRDLQARLDSLADNFSNRIYGEGKPPLPATIFPAFADRELAPKNSKAHYIKESTRRGEPSHLAKKGNPKGWEEIKIGKHSGPPEYWLRMHLLPDRIGGLATGSNLVPAPLAINNQFLRDVEDDADKARKDPSKEEIIWYQMKVEFQPPGTLLWHEYLPKRIVSKWGGYFVNSIRKWEEKPESPSRTADSGIISLPSLIPKGVTNLTRDSAEKIAIALGTTDSFGRKIKELGPFGSKADAVKKLTIYETTKKRGAPKLPDFITVTSRLLHDPSIEI